MLVTFHPTTGGPIGHAVMLYASTQTFWKFKDSAGTGIISIPKDRITYKEYLRCNETAGSHQPYTSIEPSFCGTDYMLHENKAFVLKLEPVSS